MMKTTMKMDTTMIVMMGHIIVGGLVGVDTSGCNTLTPAELSDKQGEVFIIICSSGSRTAGSKATVSLPCLLSSRAVQGGRPTAQEPYCVHRDSTSDTPGSGIAQLADPQPADGCLYAHRSTQEAILVLTAESNNAALAWLLRPTI